MTNVNPSQGGATWAWSVQKILLTIGAVVVVVSLAIIAGFILVFLSR